MTLFGSDDELIFSSLESLAQYNIWADENRAEEKRIEFEKSGEILLTDDFNNEDQDDEDEEDSNNQAMSHYEKILYECTYETPCKRDESKIYAIHCRRMHENDRKKFR